MSGTTLVRLSSGEEYDVPDDEAEAFMRGLDGRGVKFEADRRPGGAGIPGAPEDIAPQPMPEEPNDAEPDSDSDDKGSVWDQLLKAPAALGPERPSLWNAQGRENLRQGAPVAAAGAMRGYTAGLGKLLPGGAGQYVTDMETNARATDPDLFDASDMAGSVVSPMGKFSKLPILNAVLNAGAQGAARKYGDTRDVGESLESGAESAAVPAALGVGGRLAGVLGKGARAVKRGAYKQMMGGSTDDYELLAKKHGLDFVDSKIGDLPEEMGVAGSLSSKGMADRLKPMVAAEGKRYGDAIDQAAWEIAEPQPQPANFRVNPKEPARPPPLPEPPEVPVFEGHGDVPFENRNIYTRRYANEAAYPVNPPAAESEFANAPPEVRGMLERRYGSRPAPPEPSAADAVAMPPPLPRPTPDLKGEIAEQTPGALGSPVSKNRVLGELLDLRAQHSLGGSSGAPTQAPTMARTYGRLADQAAAQPIRTPRELQNLKEQYDKGVFRGAIKGSREGMASEANLAAGNAVRGQLRDVMAQASPETNAAYTDSADKFGKLKLLEELTSTTAARRSAPMPPTMGGKALRFGLPAMGGAVGYGAGGPVGMMAGAALGSAAERYGPGLTANAFRGVQSGLEGAASGMQSMAGPAGRLAAPAMTPSDIRQRVSESHTESRGYALPDTIEQELAQGGGRLGPYAQQFAQAQQQGDAGVAALLQKLVATDVQFRTQILPELQRPSGGVALP